MRKDEDSEIIRSIIVAGIIFVVLLVALANKTPKEVLSEPIGTYIYK